MNKILLEKLLKRTSELEKAIINRENITDRSKYSELLREYGIINPIVKKYERYNLLEKEKSDIKTLISNSEPDINELAMQELEEIEKKMSTLESEITMDIRKLNEKSEDTGENAIVEIRAGTGGQEAALFASDILRMYLRYAEKKGYSVDMINSHTTGLNGIKEVIFLVKGKGVYGNFKYESGTHRVQRIPLTEASGRIHTSTVTVAVLPEVDEINVKLRPEDLKIDTYRASGHGGQHIQKTDSAVRITHIPTGIVAQCQDERSQIKNREKAMKLLRSRIIAFEKQQQNLKISTERRGQIGMAKRAEKIRTYNFPQNRVTDHRINFSIHNIKSLLNGEIDEIIKHLKEQNG
ncbi:MAG: peptide chain release factor 1 [Elusimicrobiota bacterium]